MRGGRVVKEGEQPMKTVKARASTTSRMRALEVAGTSRSAGEASDQHGGVMQGLYAASQTALYVAPPVINVSPQYVHWCHLLKTTSPSGQDTEE